MSRRRPAPNQSRQKNSGAQTTVTQMRRLSPHFPLSHGIPRVDDRRVLSGIIYVIRHGLQWRDAPAAYGPHKTLYNRFIVTIRRVFLLPTSSF